jgi:hypothetical protein
VRKTLDGTCENDAAGTGLRSAVPQCLPAGWFISNYGKLGRSLGGHLKTGHTEIARNVFFQMSREQCPGRP